MKSLMLVFFVFSAFAASEDKNKKFLVRNQNKTYSLVNGFYIDQSVMNKNNIAGSVIQNKHKVNCQSLPNSNHNPSTVLCWKLLGGEVVIGQDQVGNETSFCFFKDGSSLTTDSMMKACLKR